MIPTICNLPGFSSCPGNYRASFKQPYQIKISTIIRIKTTVKKVVGVFTVLLILITVCILPITGWFNARTFTVNNRTNHQIPSYLTPYLNQLHRAIPPISPNPIIAHPTFQLKVNGRDCTHLDVMDSECNEERAYQNAYYYAHQKIVNSFDILEQNSKKIVKFILKTNALQTHYIQKKPGELRTNNPFIVLNNVDTSKEGLKNSFFEQGGSEADIESFNSFYNKLDTYAESILLQSLSPDELKVYKTLGYNACPPDEILSKLNKLANQIQGLARGVKNHTIDTIAAAAFIHQELMKIHPFKDDCILTARIWMLNILHLGGFEQIDNLPKKEYGIAIVKDIHDPGIFADFLERVIASNRKYI